MPLSIDTLRERLQPGAAHPAPDGIDLIDEAFLLQLRGGDREYAPVGSATDPLHEQWQLPAFLFSFTT
jgi:hypothetical protein